MDTNHTDLRLPDLERARQAVLDTCTRCGKCVKACAFLQRHGDPASQAETLDADDVACLETAFACSLCSLCTAVCPFGADPMAMFLAMRGRAVERGGGEFPQHTAIARYEAIGSHPAFTLRAIPPGGDTVFFPGCTLPGTRPGATERLYDHLRQSIPRLGLVLQCCAKPSHDLGRESVFAARFGALRDELLQAGVRRVITACPNCHKVFSSYGRGLETLTAYEHMAAHGGPAPFCAPDNIPGSVEVAVHDPCPQRFLPETREAVRALLTSAGLRVAEMKHSGERTVCCGEGGSVGFLHPDLARGWTELRHREAQDRPVVAACAGCAGYLGEHAVHVLDALFDPASVVSGGGRTVGWPWVYGARLLLKRRMKRRICREKF